MKFDPVQQKNISEGFSLLDDASHPGRKEQQPLVSLTGLHLPPSV